MTYEDFKSQMTRNQERLARNEEALQLQSDDVAQIIKLARPLNVLVLAEDWCGDVIDNLPILGRIAKESGKLTLRVFLRDQNLDIMDQYLNRGEFRSIPVFVFFDDAFNEICRFTERPASVTERRRLQRQAVYAAHPEFGSPDTPVGQLPEEVRATVMQALASVREESRPADIQDVVRELREI